MIGHFHAPKVYELHEIQTEKPATKAAMRPLIHLYQGFAMCCDGEKTIKVELTDEQVLRLAAQATELAARILRRSDSCAVESPSKASPSCTPSPR